MLEAFYDQSISFPNLRAQINFPFPYFSSKDKYQFLNVILLHFVSNIPTEYHPLIGLNDNIFLSYR